MFKNPGISARNYFSFSDLATVLAVLAIFLSDGPDFSDFLAIANFHKPSHLLSLVTTKQARQASCLAV